MLFSFDGRWCAKVFFEAFGIKFFMAVVGVDAVLFLLHIGELGVTISGNVGVIGECLGEFFDAMIHFFNVCGACAVTPAAFAVGTLFGFCGVCIPPSATVFVNDIGCAIVGDGEFWESDGCIF